MRLWKRHPTRFGSPVKEAWYWGRAYDVDYGNELVLVVIPLNLVVRAAMWIYYRLVMGFYPAKWERWLEHRFNRGFEAGREFERKYPLRRDG